LGAPSDLNFGPPGGPISRPYFVAFGPPGGPLCGPPGKPVSGPHFLPPGGWLAGFHTLSETDSGPPRGSISGRVSPTPGVPISGPLGFHGVTKTIKFQERDIPNLWANGNLNIGSSGGPTDQPAVLLLNRMFHPALADGGCPPAHAKGGLKKTTWKSITSNDGWSRTGNRA